MNFSEQRLIGTDFTEILLTPARKFYHKIQHFAKLGAIVLSAIKKERVRTLARLYPDSSDKEKHLKRKPDLHCLLYVSAIYVQFLNFTIKKEKIVLDLLLKNADIGIFR